MLGYCSSSEQMKGYMNLTNGTIWKYWQNSGVKSYDYNFVTPQCKNYKYYNLTMIQPDGKELNITSTYSDFEYCWGIGNQTCYFVDATSIKVFSNYTGKSLDSFSGAISLTYYFSVDSSYFN